MGQSQHGVGQWAFISKSQQGLWVMFPCSVKQNWITISRTHLSEGVTQGCIQRSWETMEPLRGEDDDPCRVRAFPKIRLVGRHTRHEPNYLSTLKDGVLVHIEFHWGSGKGCLEGCGYRHGNVIRLRVIIGILEKSHLPMFLSERDPTLWQHAELTPIYITPFGKEIIACIPGQAVSKGKGAFWL